MHRNRNRMINFRKLMFQIATVILILTMATFAAADRYIDEVIDFIRPPGSSSAGGPAESAIGPPDARGGASGTGFVSIDIPESLIVAFTDNLAWDGPGEDVKLYEYLDGDSDAEIYVSKNNVKYEFIAITDKDFTFDLANYGLDYIQYVKIVGLQNGGGSAGYDLDAIEALNPLETFVDVPSNYWAKDFIYKIYNAGITTGCSKNPLKYCPLSPVTRAQMAIFLLRSKLGSSYTPPAATGIFDDVPVGSFAADWIEDLFNRGITTGCEKNPLNYCPGDPVTRAQMAIFLLRSMFGSSYTPPPATGIFDDVPVGSFAANWIEDLFDRGITTGCQKNPLLYCPSSSITRAQMTVFLVRMFDL